MLEISITISEYEELVDQITIICYNGPFCTFPGSNVQQDEVHLYNQLHFWISDGRNI